MALSWRHLACLIVLSLGAAPLFGQPSATPGRVVLLRFQAVSGQAQDPAIESAIDQALADELSRRGYLIERSSAPPGPIAGGAAVAIGGYYARSQSGRLSLYGLLIDTRSGTLIDAASRRSVLDLPGAERALQGVRRQLEENDESAIERFSGRIIQQLELNPSRRLRLDNLLEHTPESERAALRNLWPDDEARGSREREAFALLEDQTVTTATRSQRTVRTTPAVVYVINERQIRERGYRTLVEALEDVPGMEVIHVYGIFSELVHQRGLVGNNQRMLVYVDGILDNNISERATLSGTLHFPLFNVERIEVVLGPSSALYGANAFGGVVQIFTKGGDRDPGGGVEATYGRYLDQGYAPGASAAMAIRGSSPDSSMHYSAAATYYKSRGPFFGDRQDLRSASVNENDPYWKLEQAACGGPCIQPKDAIGYDWSPYYNASQEESYNVSARFQAGGFSLRTVNWQQLQGQGTFSNATNTVDTDRLGFAVSAWDFRNNSLAMAYNWQIATSLNLESEIAVRHTEILGSSRDQTINNAPDAEYYFSLNRSRDFTLNDGYSRADNSLEWRERIDWSPYRRLQLQAGAEAVQETTPRGYGASETYIFTNYAGYLQGQWRFIDPVELLLGYRYDSNSNFGVAHTPRLGLTVAPNDWLTLRAMASAGFRAPTPWELFNATAQRLANPDLKPERMRSYELGFGLRFFRAYYLQATAFQNEIRDLLLEVRSNQLRPDLPGVYYNQNQNVGSALVRGAELQLDAGLTEALTLALGYTYSKGEYRDLPPEQTAPLSTRGRPGDDYVRDALEALTGIRAAEERGPIPNIPAHRVSAGVTWRPIENLSVHLRANYSDVRRTIASNPEKTTPGYLLWHLNLRYEDAFGWTGFYLNLLVRNLGDDSAYDPGIRIADGGYYPSRHPIEERNVWLSVGYRY